MTEREKAGGVDDNVHVSPLFMDVVLQLAEKYEDMPNDEYHRQMLYMKLQQTMQEYVSIEPTHGG